MRKDDRIKAEAKQRKEVLDTLKLPPIPGVEIHEDTPENPWKPPAQSQAERIIAKFGGPKELYTIFKELGVPRALPTIYKWTHAKEDGGTGGLIPTSVWHDLWRAARYAGVVISSEDMDPREDPPLVRNPRIREHKRKDFKPR